MPALKPRSSFHKLKLRIGLEKDKDLPPPPSAVGGGQELSAASQAEPSSSRSPTVPHAPAGAMLPVDARRSTDARPRLSRESYTRAANPKPTLPPLATTELPPQQPTMMPKKSNPLLRMTSRLRPAPRDTQAHSPADDGLRPTDVLSPTDSKLGPCSPVEEAAKTRREDALRAMGLRPSVRGKMLSQIEAEENARLGIAPLPEPTSEGPSAATALIESWRAKNADAPAAAAEPHLQPPRSARSHEDDAQPAPTTPTTPGRAENNEKVTQWLQGSPPRSPKRSPRARDSEGARLAAFTMPRAAHAVTGGCREANADADPASPITLDVASPITPAGDAEEPEDTEVALASPRSLTRLPAVPEHAHLAPPSPVLQESESETSCSASAEPLTPSTTSGSLRTRAASGAARVPHTHVPTPVIVETAEETILRDERGIMREPGADVDEFGTNATDDKGLPPVPASAPPANTLRPQVKGRGARHSLMFTLGSKPARSATLDVQAQGQGQAPTSVPALGAAKSLGNLKRGLTLSSASRARAAEWSARRERANAAVQAQRPAVTMHGMAGIVSSVQHIDDEEERRLAELAFVC